ncbi:hypothetical protein KAH27_10665 [bacterium]|nr:hypothetical protein [bacterium]
MKTLALLFLTIFSLNIFADTEIELATGSRFKGEIKKITSRYVIVETKIGELKLTKQMLSPRCRSSLKASMNQKDKGEKIDADVKVSYKQKTLSKEKESFRRGAKREFKEKAGIITIRFDALPGGKDYSGRVEYVFTAENRGRKRGKYFDLDHGIKTFEIQANQRNPEVIIQSKSVSHIEASHTGDKLGERGAELKGYRVKVYLEGSLVFEGEK